MFCMGCETTATVKIRLGLGQELWMMGGRDTGPVEQGRLPERLTATGARDTRV